MLYITNPVIKHKTGLLNLAVELSNVSKVCKNHGRLTRYLLPLSRTGL